MEPRGLSFFRVSMPIDSAILLVLFMQPFLGHSASKWTSWLSGSYNLSAPLSQCSLSRRFGSFVINASTGSWIPIMGSLLISTVFSAMFFFFFLLWSSFAGKRSFIDKGW